MRCYCCSSKSFDECCEPFIKGDKRPISAEQLMRSRFAAYATAHYQYVLNTYIKEKQRALSVKDLAQGAEGARWFALKVHNSEIAPTPRDKTNMAVVEFTAYYFENKSVFQLHETSSFIVEEDEWRYRDGVLHDDCGKIKYGRNLPCVCGSNKKFKQCCALKQR
ncbi:zinc chelation protein SecC [Alteromonas sp. V450]|uniref:YchJ family protein n=1 Tax=Alteromonas sp. V450 TaxID=1912139 RepID=UPI0008FF42FE|nr:YchJ family metal-binding protein [Alteromonas sp. V450]OJF68348.1 zinc chelation protein SecC [Alteromonas sp. V450]